MEMYVGNINGGGKGVDAGFRGDEHGLGAVCAKVALAKTFVGRDVGVTVRVNNEDGKSL